MSNMIKFLKSLVSSEPVASKVLTQSPEVIRQATVSEIPQSQTSSSSHSSPNVQSVKPHVPLIKFRKGGPATSHTAITGAPSPGAVSGRAAVSRGIIEDYQLPSRYHRSPIDEKEIDYINRGGPE